MGQGPEQARLAQVWSVAVGLQDAEGLKPSTTLLALALEHIAGRMTMAEVRVRMRVFHTQTRTKKRAKNYALEADLAACGIVSVLTEQSFRLFPGFLMFLHRRIFCDVLPHAGAVRTHELKRREWAAAQHKVRFEPPETIFDALEETFWREKSFVYSDAQPRAVLAHVAQLLAQLWRIAPFEVGLTRTLAVFTLGLMRSLGYRCSVKPFARHAWFFHNALVRASFSDAKRGYKPEPRYLEEFLENLIFSGSHALINRTVRVPERSASGKKTQTTGRCTKAELRALAAIGEDPNITQQALADLLGKSVRTVKTLTVRMQDKGLIRRKNGKRHGFWVIATL